jgi:hypothetical protein
MYMATRIYRSQCPLCRRVGAFWKRLCRREELHAARLSGKRLLTLWNALPDVACSERERQFFVL